MAFGDTGLLFLVANSDGVTRRVLFDQENPCALSYDGANTLSEDGGTGQWVINAGGVSTGTVTVTFLRRAFKLLPNSPGSKDGTLWVDLDELAAMAGEAAPAPTFRERIIDAFLGGGTATLSLGSDGPNEDLVVNLRALETADFLLLENITTNAGDASPAHHIPTATVNLVLPGGDPLTNYTFHLAEAYDASFSPLGTYQTPVTADSAGVLTIPSSYHAPPDSATRNLKLRIQQPTLGKTSLLPVDIHVPTDVIVSFDRSGSMGAFIDGSATLKKWTAAESVGNLFSTLFGTLLPDLSLPNGSLAAENRTLLTKWYFDGVTTQFVHEPASGSFSASNSPPAFAPDNPGGGTPIGDALIDGRERFAANSTSKWRRRHMILLTDGMHNSGTVALDNINNGGQALPVPASDGSDDNGIVLHTVQYAVGTEAFNPHLQNDLNNGQNHDSSADTDPLNSDGLLEMYLNVLGGILPVNLAVAGASDVTVPVEDGIERIVFVATDQGASASDLQLSNGTEGTGGGDAANGLTWVVADNPTPGDWTIDSTPGGTLFAVYDLALRFRSGAEPAGIGQPIKLWAELSHRGQPVTGADVRVGTRRPAESVGELLTAFVRDGGLQKALGAGRILDIAANGRIDVAVNAGAQATDTPSVQTVLLRLAEGWRNLPLQFTGDAITMTEVAPGRYEATVPPGDTENEYVRNFYFRADGATPKGFRFARNTRTSVLLDPVPDPAQSDSTLVRGPVVDRTVTWTATVFPKTASSKPAGPGLAHYFYFQYLDPRDQKSRPPLQLVDKLDGTYATNLVLKLDERPPAIGFFPRTGKDHRDKSVIRIEPDKPICGKIHKVRVVLNRLQVLDDKDGLWSGKGELAFDAVVAPNGNPHRAVRTRIPEQGVMKLGCGQTLELSDAVLYEGLVEAGASLSIAIGGTEFDWILFFKRKEKLARYHRRVKLEKGRHKFAPTDEPHDPESLRDWRVWYTVEVS